MEHIFLHLSAHGRPQHSFQHIVVHMAHFVERGVEGGSAVSTECSHFPLDPSPLQL